MAPTLKLGLFAKYWEPGKVKTRLAATIGEEKAAGVYLAFVQTLLRRFGSTTRRDAVVACSPDDRETEFQTLARNLTRDLAWEAAHETSPEDFAEACRWNFQPQGNGDLGQRMKAFFSSAFADGYEKAMIVGTDSPTLPDAYIEQVFWLLNQNEVVLGPSEDGGYYLVAARGRVPPIFAGISWSSDKVWFETVACLQAARIRFAVLPHWYDVDTEQDLNRLRVELNRTATSDLHAGSTRERSAANLLAQKLNEILDG